MSKQILVAEDNENNRLVVCDLLVHFGYGIHEAENGKEAVHMAREIMPDLILMDIRMPVMDGITAMKQLKSDDVTARIRIIALTAFAMKPDHERLQGAGFDGYITKPLDIRALPKTVQMYMEKQQEDADWSWY